MAVKSGEIRHRVRQRLIAAGRIALVQGGGVSDEFIEDVCRQSGIHPHAFRVLFPADEKYFEAVYDLLVIDCAERLRGGVAVFIASKPDENALSAAAVALAASWPLDRGSMVFRGERRLRALRDGIHGSAVAKSERQFLGALAQAFEDLMTGLGREFTWTPLLAVRVIVDTYERSFETWLQTGHDETDFEHSPFVRRTLPKLLNELSRVRPG